MTRTTAARGKSSAKSTDKKRAPTRLSGERGSGKSEQALARLAAEAATRATQAAMRAATESLSAALATQIEAATKEMLDQTRQEVEAMLSSARSESQRILSESHRVAAAWRLLAMTGAGYPSLLEYGDFERSEFSHKAEGLAVAVYDRWLNVPESERHHERAYGRRRDFPFTPRQTQVLLLLTWRPSVDFVAEELGISPSTVRSHVAEIYRRLQEA